MKMWSGKTYSIVIAVLMVCVMSVPAAAQLADTPWPMFHHDLNHTGLSQYHGPDTPAIKWNFSTGNRITSSAVIGEDGTIYVGTRNYQKANTGSKLYAIYPNGTEKWQRAASHFIDSTPAVASDGTVYVGSWDKCLYAIYPNGTKRWEFCTPCGGFVLTSPAIAPDGTIYVGSNDKKLYAIYPNGTEKWNYCTGQSVQSSPAIGSDGIIYVGSCDKKLYAIYLNGTEKWNYCTGQSVQSSPAIDANGIIYVGSKDGKLYAIYPNGTLNWAYTMGGKVESSPAIDANGIIYVGSKDGKLYAIYPNGTLNWVYATGGEVVSSPAIDADGTIYVGSKDGYFYAIKPNNTLLWRHYTGNEIRYSSPAIASDGTVYIGNWGGNLYAFGPGTQPPGTSNIPPVLDAIGDRTINEAETVAIDLNASDPNGDTLTYSCNRTTDLFTNFDSSTGTGSWITGYGDSGTYWVNFGVSDGNGEIDNETIQITVLDVNEAPVLDPVGNKVISETETVAIDLNASDPNGDTLTYSCNRTTDLFTNFDSSTGTGSWITGYGDSGTYWVNFGVSDGNGEIDNETIQITVLDANGLPFFDVVGGGECRKIGEQFDVLINITPMGIPLMGAQFDLHFNASALKAETVTYGNFLTQDGWSSIHTPHSDIDNVNGVVSFAAARQGTSEGVTGPGAFAIVHFTAETQGMTSELNLTNALASDNATPVNTYELVTHNDTVEVCLNTPPVAVAKSNFTYNNIAEKGLSKAYFIGTDSSDDQDGNITNYRWWVDDGSSLVGEIAEHLFVVPRYWNSTIGDYVNASVTLTVTDDGMPLMDADATMEVIVYIAGDATGDGRVNIADGVTFGMQFGKSGANIGNPDKLCWEGVPEGDKADLNNDGRVNIGDAMLLGTCWGHTAW